MITVPPLFEITNHRITLAITAIVAAAALATVAFAAHNKQWHLGTTTTTASKLDLSSFVNKKTNDNL